MIYHIINAAIRSPMTIVAARHQYDYGQALSITGITLPDVFEAHFAGVDGSQTVTMLGHNGVVEIPDELFQVAKAIVCYIYLHDEATDGRTVYTIKIPVKERPEPSDVEPTPVQQDIITQAIAALNDAVEQTAADVSHYPKVIDGTWHIYDAESESWVDTGDSAQGPKGDKGDTGDTGPTGPQGETGPQGPKGDTGETGATGPKGDKGDKGDQGIQGIQGVQGEKGDTGDKGEKGDTGEKGDKGDPGEVTLADFYKAFATDTVSGAIAHFTDGADSIPMKDVLVHIEPVQEGSGDPSPDNVRPITGWTGAKVTRTGKNLLNLVESEMVLDGWNRLFPISLKAGTYIISCQNQFGASSAKGARVLFTSENYATTVKELSNYYTFGDSTFVGMAVTITEEEASEIKNIQFLLRAGNVSYNDIVQGNIQLELGSTATAYEPYSGQTYDIIFPAEAGTVYGGTLDVTKGELVVDRICHIYEGGMDDIITSRSIDSSTKWLSIRTATAYNHAVSGNAQDSFNLIKPLCDKLKPTWFLDAISATNCYAPQGNWAPAHIIKVDGLTTVDEYDVWCAENKPQISWLLATPITYQLTPQEITSLLGENNVWADTGDSDVEYRADTKLYITKKITEAVSALS